MENLFIATAKYMFILLMAFYVFLSFVLLRDKNKKSYKNALSVQSWIIYAIHLCGFIIIYMHDEKDTVILFYGAQLIYFIIFKGLFSVLYDEYYHAGLLNNTCMLLSVGFIMLSRLSYDKAIRQFVIVVAASILVLLIPSIINRMKALKHMRYIYCFAGIAFLAAVLIIGQLSYGAKLSIEIAGFSFQPSEFVKILYVFFLASLFQKSRRFKYVVISAIFAGMHVIILVLSHDLGNALIFFIVYIMMLYVATCRFFYVIAGTIAGSGAACIAYRFFSHVRVRVQAYLDPWSFIDTGGYQVAQSLFAIGTGGLLGLGLYKGAPKTIPVVEEDFIFSAISEELGMIFAISIVILYINCFICFIKISMKQTELFYKLVGLGLAVTYAVQTILTVGGAIKFIPSTGVTLPLISYGGSSVLCTMISFAIIQGLEVRRKVLEEAYEEDNEEDNNKTYDNEDTE